MRASYEGPSQNISQRGVLLVGRRSVQNGLLTELIGRELGRACELRAPHALADLPVPAGALALLDIEGLPVADVARYVDTLFRAERCLVALFNVDETNVDSVVFPGVRGIFSRETSTAQLANGIRAIFAGEYWLPRRILAAHFERNGPHRLGTGANAAMLTPKESETLELLTLGNGNDSIARRLGVSPHTVKTHVYNLFRKLGVKNRVQAVNWAMLNLRRTHAQSD
jgi:DNA-binding NarL/FixJ family response regulator